MIHPRPVVVVGVPRSGTSLVSATFAAHGLWTGSVDEGDERNPLGFFQNDYLRAAMFRCVGSLVDIGALARFTTMWQQEATEQLLIDGYDTRAAPQWMYKHSTLYWPIWRNTDWEPYFVVTRRDPKKSYESMWDTRVFKNPMYPEDVFAAHIGWRDYLIDRGWPCVDFERLLARDYEQLRQAYNFCRIPFDEAIVDNLVRPEYSKFS